MDAIKQSDSNSYCKFTGKSELDKAISTLIGIVDGITIDNSINEDEMAELANWISINSPLEKIIPFNEIIPMIKAALSDGVIDEEEIKDLIWVCNNFKHDGIYYDMVTLSIQNLHGLMHGILADNTITDEEIIGLKEWIDNHSFLECTYPFEELKSLILSILDDGVITELEREQLKAYMGEFIDCSTSYNLIKAELIELHNKYNIVGICTKNPNVKIPTHLFCFTGKSSRASRNEIKDIIIAHDGKFNNNVVKDTEYLVVGDEGNPCWAFCCYGRKVEKAIEMRKEGKNILLVHEEDFWNVV
ncbi:BRCT domain-containing protein [Aminipila terrae]|uniref:NAD-dependent DNA ligase n=1 Tax=Aminipila terrae TaxID=2697030 RepID=A0A6P1MIC0_9FIRM|nr:BRCT domain-containing protein [Aminipila terrae]QHI73812.1 NAD-dependent DNA ligase [Aminipila terrae]